MLLRSCTTMARLKTEKNREKWLPDHPGCPIGHVDYGISEVKQSSFVNSSLTGFFGGRGSSAVERATPGE